MFQIYIQSGSEPGFKINNCNFYINNSKGLQIIYFTQNGDLIVNEYHTDLRTCVNKINQNLKSGQYIVLINKNAHKFQKNHLFNKLLSIDGNFSGKNWIYLGLKRGQYISKIYEQYDPVQDINYTDQLCKNETVVNYNTEIYSDPIGQLDYQHIHICQETDYFTRYTLQDTNLFFMKTLERAILNKFLIHPQISVISEFHLIFTIYCVLAKDIDKNICITANDGYNMMPKEVPDKALWDIIVYSNKINTLAFIINGKSIVKVREKFDPLSPNINTIQEILSVRNNDLNIVNFTNHALHNRGITNLPEPMNILVCPNKGENGTYNKDTDIVACLQSLLNQDYQNVQISVILGPEDKLDATKISIFFPNNKKIQIVEEAKNENYHFIMTSDTVSEPYRISAHLYYGLKYSIFKVKKNRLVSVIDFHDENNYFRDGQDKVIDIPLYTMWG